MILTEEGAKAIEEILAGDLVLTWDEETGEVKTRPVLQTYVNETEELVHIRTTGEEIISTPGHPFYSPVKGWTSAIELRAGDILVLVNDEYVVVEQVQHEILEAPVKVYNFNVAECHTYYVTDSGVLVHNACEVIGSGHGAAEHKETIGKTVEELNDSGNYSKIYVNRALKTVGLNGSQRPDIIAIGTNGSIHLWEVASASQKTGRGAIALCSKISIMISNNPGIIAHYIP